MDPKNRIIIAAIMFALTILGVGAGIRLAQLDEKARIDAATEKKRLAESTISGYGYPILKPDEEFLAKQPPEKKPVPQPAAKPAQPADPDGITAEAYLVGDILSGRIYFEKSPDKVVPFASMSKLITALVATDLYDSAAKITITAEETLVPPDASGLKAGESLTVKELLYPLLMNSSNVAGEALASSSNRMQFLKLMSDYSWELGMPESHLADPTGLSPSNSGTARGFFGMARYLHNKRPDILAITRIATTSIASTTEHSYHLFSSIHPFVDDPGFLGGKTGRTNEALETMLTILKVDEHPTAFIVLRSRNRARDTLILIQKLTGASF